MSSKAGRGGQGATAGNDGQGATLGNGGHGAVLATLSWTLSTVVCCVNRAVSGSEFVSGALFCAPVLLARDIGRFGIGCAF